LDSIPIASVAAALDNTLNGEIVMLVLNEALCFGNQMSHSLICPNQIWWNGVVDNDTPNMFDEASTQSIIIPGKLELPLAYRGRVNQM
jgi:hypothetical protein